MAKSRTGQKSVCGKQRKRKKMTKKRMIWFTILALLTLVVAACATTEEAMPTVAPAPTATEAVVEVPAEPTEDEMVDEEMSAPSIAEVAIADGRFTTLVAALQAAGLAETLSSEGAYTVFAPTDEAFAALPEGTVESLLEDPQGALSSILLYHVVDGVVPAETVVTLESAETLQGEPVSIEVVDGEVLLNGTVQVIITDIEASNGVIHVIDAVLMPPSMQ
jgi:transforming growth factor-beta-induced protein